jgi:hypothetical protein
VFFNPPFLLLLLVRWTVDYKQEYKQMFINAAVYRLVSQLAEYASERLNTRVSRIDVFDQIPACLDRHPEFLTQQVELEKAKGRTTVVYRLDTFNYLSKLKEEGKVRSVSEGMLRGVACLQAHRDDLLLEELRRRKLAGSEKPSISMGLGQVRPSQ